MKHSDESEEVTLPEQSLFRRCSAKAKAKRAARRQRRRCQENKAMEPLSRKVGTGFEAKNCSKNKKLKRAVASSETKTALDSPPSCLAGALNLRGQRKSPKACAKQPAQAWSFAARPVLAPKAAWSGRHVPQGAELYAALDLGTNNCRLLIAAPTSPGRFRTVERFSRIVRLGEGVANQDILSDEAMERAMEALDVCRFKLSQWPIQHQRFIATQACRQAVNGSQFLKRVRAQLGLDLEIVSRETEARLAVAGCSTLVERETQALVLFDIGGGSSEIALVDMSRRRSHRLAEHIIAWTSLPVGVVTLTERFGGSHVSVHDFNCMKTYVESLIDQFEGRDKLGDLVKCPSFHLLGTSGTMTTLAGIHLELERYDRRRIDGVWMCGEDVTRMTQRLLSWNMEQRMANPCIGPDRADLVLAGCAILEAIRAHWPSQRLRVADRGLREGILMELMAHQRAWSV